MPFIASRLKHCVQCSFPPALRVAWP